MEGYEGDGGHDGPEDIRALKQQLDQIEVRKAAEEQANNNNATRQRLRQKIKSLGGEPCA